MPELRRSLTLYSLTMVAIGSTIGAGIFRSPGIVAQHAHLPEYIIALWLLGGVVALSGALTFAEMGGMFPGAGGLYGDVVGFLYGWFILFCSTAGAIAALALVCSEHLNYLYGSGRDSVWELPLAAGIIILLTIVNLFGVGIGEWPAANLPMLFRRISSLPWPWALSGYFGVMAAGNTQRIWPEKQKIPSETYHAL